VTAHRRSPRRFSLAIDQMTAELAPETALADAQRAWPDAVGPAIAAEAKPIAERGGVLTISCSASVWAQELELMAPAILERLNGRMRGAAITRLRCVAVPPYESF
jgi:predicted nucleic acid-binding Zn ribbon protein